MMPKKIFLTASSCAALFLCVLSGCGGGGGGGGGATTPPPAEFSSALLINGAEYTLNKAVLITQEEVFDCDGKKIIFNGGLVRILKGAALTLSNCRIDIQGRPANQDVASIIVAGAFLMKKGLVKVDTERRNASGAALYDVVAPQWIIAGDIESSSSDSVRIEITDSRFTVINQYSAGVIVVKPLDAVVIPALENPRHKLVFSNNYVKNAHGVVVASELSDSIVNDNVIEQSSFAQVALSGSRLKVRGNKIYYPGNGTTGDGITLNGAINDVVVEDNIILNGTCYGIWVNTELAKNVSISGNTIVGGVTTAILVGTSLVGGGSALTDVRVSDNTLFSNAGFAVAVCFAQNVQVVGNRFSGNAPGFPSQLLECTGSVVSYSGNMLTEPLTVEWAESIEEFKTPVMEMNQPFLYTVPAE